MADNVVIKIDGDASGFEKSLKGIGRDVKAGMADIKAGIDLATAAVGKFAAVAKSGIEYNANIERYLTSFEVMTGSAEKAADVVERLRRMGAETPFEMEDLANTTQLLMQYGFTAEESLDRMRMLGDVAQGNKEAMNSIALGYAQMSSAQKVNLQDIKQMINGGFNPLQEISERTGESMASLYDRISKGKMSVDEITESMRYATSEGGKFFQSMEKQSQTLNGQLSTLKDNANQLLGSLTEGLSEELRTELLPLANNMIGDLESAFAQGGTQGLIDAATDMVPALLNMMSGEVQSAISGLSKWLPKGASALMKAVPGAVRGASSVIPQVTSALFEVASTVTTDLVSMLPELTPIVIGGFVDMVGSVLKGTESVIQGLFAGIEQMFHQGQDKIAGVWVDSSNVAEIKASIDADIDFGDAETEIETAFSTVRAALQTDLLTDEQRKELTKLIGEDYDTIKAKLLSFGLSEEEAKPIADAFANAGNALQTDMLTDKQKEEIIKLIGTDYDTIKAKLLSFGLSEDEANSIAKTMTDAGSALKTDILTDQQQQEIINMIGSDYDAIKAKLLSFGLSEKEATSIADSVTTAGSKLTEAYSGLDVGIDPVTLVKLSLQANGSRLKLKSLLKQAGLKDSDVTQVVSVYDTMMGKVKDQTPSIIEEIYDKLTDGKPDDEQTVTSLKNQINGYIDGLLTDLETAYAAKSAELDTTAADYNEKKAALDEWYNSTKTSINSMNTDMTTLVDTLAGAPASVVKARMDELVAMEQTLFDLEEKIEAMTGKTKSAAENAFAVVRSGANADAATIGTAINFKVTEFKLDEQAAEDAYNAAVDQLNADLASGKITQGEYDDQIESKQLELESAKQAAKAAYEKAMAEIFQGIAESEGNAEAFDKAMEATGAKISVQDFFDNMYTEDGNIDTSMLDSVKEQLAGVLGDAFSPERVDELVEKDDALGLINYLETMAGAVDGVSKDSMKTAIGGKVGEAWQAALESGVLEGTSFDVTGTEAQLAALFSSVANNASSTASPDVEAAGTSLGETATDAMSNPDGAESAGRETLNGLDYALSKGEDMAYKRGYQTGKAYAKGYEEAAEIRSPSRVMRRLGEYTGQGLEIGLRESMANAVMVAKRMTGQIVTAADISTAAKVNFGGLSQEIMAANEQTATPVYLDGQQIASIQGYNNTAQLAWQNVRAAKGVGSR